VTIREALTQDPSAGGSTADGVSTP
jgi:hypothetical protein